MSSRAMVIVGAGSSARFGADKLMSDIGGRPLLEITAQRIITHVDRCVLVVRADQVERISALGLEVTVTAGGSTRTLSEMAGLAAVGDEVDLIGVHDAARPLVSGTMIDNLFETAERIGGAVPVLDSDQLILDRRTNRRVEGLKRAQTPQVFQSNELLIAYVRAAQANFEGHDTADVVQAFSDLRIATVPGDPTNLKVTFPEDLETVRTAVRT